VFLGWRLRLGCWRLVWGVQEERDEGGGVRYGVRQGLDSWTAMSWSNDGIGDRGGLQGQKVLSPALGRAQSE